MRDKNQNTAFTEQKVADYKEYSVTKEVPSYFNIFGCGRNVLDRRDVTYEQACMATPKDKNYEKMLETLVGDNNLKGALFSNEKLQQAVSKVMEGTEAEFECLHKIIMDTSFQSPKKIKMCQQSTIMDIMSQTIR